MSKSWRRPIREAARLVLTRRGRWLVAPPWLPLSYGDIDDESEHTFCHHVVGTRGGWAARLGAAAAGECRTAGDAHHPVQQRRGLLPARGPRRGRGPRGPAVPPGRHQRPPQE